MIIDEIKKEGLTLGQIEAIETINEDLEIVACAGAGKTKTITLRIINLIANGVKPENIVAITFTRKAAQEMKSRIYAAGEKYLGNTIGFAGMYIGTIDAFCLKMLQDIEPEFAKFSVLDEVQTRIFLERFSGKNSDKTGFNDSVIDKAYNLGNKYEKKLAYYIGLMSILNNCWYDRGYRDNWDEDTKARLDAYNKCLYENKYFDYSSLIREMIERLDPDSERNGGNMSDFGEKVFEKVKYLIIDEYQDTNPPQEHLAELFHKYGDTNLCVVGDADQTIYQFRGSDESNILGFAQKYNAKKINLNFDFRSTEAVIDIANASIGCGHVDDKDYVRMERGRIEGYSLEYEEGDTVCSGFETYDEETDFISDRIAELHELGIPYAEMAVLFRKRRELNFGEVQEDFQLSLVEKLKERGIPYIVEGMNMLHITKEYRASCAIFSYINSVIKKDDDSEQNPFERIQNGGASYLEALEKSWKAVGQEYGDPALVEGLDRALQSLSGKDWGSIKYGHDLNMQQIFQDFIGHMAFIEREDEAAERLLYNLGKYSRIIADFEFLFYKESPSFKTGRFMHHINRVADGLYPEGIEDNTYIRGDAVRLMTIHQSKGLEFAAVFIPALCQHVFPGESFSSNGKIYGPIDAIDSMSSGKGHRWIPNHRGYKGGVESERKLFYVAVTRAKKYLFLTYASQYGDLSEIPSMFLKETKKSAYLKEYSPNIAFTDKHLPGMRQDPLPVVLNFSLLSNYFDCPYRFKLSNFYGFVQPYNSSQGYGKMLHEIMMHMHRAWLDGEELTKKQIDDMAEDALYLPFASKPQLDKSLKGAKACVQAYVEQNKKDADKLIASELDINIEMGQGVSVNGRIDLVKRFDTGEVAIVDLKSAGKDAEQCLNTEQLKIYAIGYEEMTGEKADQLMIYNLDHPDGSKNAQEKVDRKNLKTVRDSVMDAANKIRGSELPRRKSGKCKNCYLSGLCQ